MTTVDLNYIAIGFLLFMMLLYLAIKVIRHILRRDKTGQKAFDRYSKIPIKQQEKIFKAAKEAANIESPQVRALAECYFRKGVEWAIEDDLKDFPNNRIP